jgi:Zn-dependent protease with chaperone function
VLLGLPLVLPIVAAIAYARAVLPEVAILEPPARAITQGKKLIHLLLLSDGRHEVVVPYALSGSAGPWLVAIGLSVSAFMLLRRFAGAVAVHRLIRRSRPAEEVRRKGLEMLSARLAGSIGLNNHPELLVLPKGVSGAFAVGGKRGKILISEDLLHHLSEHELEAIIAHEMAHLDARDCRLMFLAGILRDMVAWNPLAHVSFRQLARDREFEADRRAAIATGKPLAVASGLLKVCEFMRSGTRRRSRLAVAFLKPGGQVARRVHRLIALADGGTPVAVSGVVPFVLAGCLATTLGLYSGAQISAHDGAAVAFVLGAPDTDGTTRPLGRTYASLAEEGRGRSRAEIPRRKWIPSYRAETYPIRPGYLPEWIARMGKVAKKHGLSPATLQWEAQNWQASPLFSAPQIGGIGIYAVSLDKRSLP